MNDSGKYRNMCFTLCNYTEEEYNGILNSQYIKYVIIGKETAPTTGMLHLQGYAEFYKQQRFSTVKKICSRMHFQARKGSQKEAIAYCKKEGDFIERGIACRQGRRNDLNNFLAFLADGKSIKWILQNNNINYQQLRFLQLAEPYLYKQKFINRKIIWCYGPTGSGKTHFAKTFTNIEDIYFKDVNSKWWCGYTGQSVVVMDEIRADNIKFSYLLYLFQDLPVRVEYKGGSIPLVADTIILTSPYTPMQLYGGSVENMQQLIRRIAEIKYFNGDNSLSSVRGNSNNLTDDFNLPLCVDL